MDGQAKVCRPYSQFGWFVGFVFHGKIVVFHKMLLYLVSFIFDVEVIVLISDFHLKNENSEIAF